MGFAMISIWGFCIFPCVGFVPRPVLIKWKYSNSHLGIIMVIIVFQYRNTTIPILENYNGNYGISIWKYSHSHLGIMMVIVVFQYGNAALPNLELFQYGNFAIPILVN